MEEGGPAGTPPGDGDLSADVTQAARRLRHRLSLVATLPAVRRLRNFLNPNSRLPDSCSRMTLLGCSYDRVPPVEQRRGMGPSATPPGSYRTQNDVAAGNGTLGDDEATGPGGVDAVNGEGTVETREGESQQRGATGGERQETRAGAAVAAVVEGFRARFGRAGAGESSPAQPTASPSPRGTDRTPASPRFGGVFAHQPANATGLGDDEDPGLRSFVEDFHSRVWITYRRGFPQIGGGTYTTDAGWGCTLRSGQMLLANALQSHFFGRQWRWEIGSGGGSAGQAHSSTEGTGAGHGTGTGAGAAAGVASLLQRWDSGWNGADRSDAVAENVSVRVSPADAAHVRLLGWFGDHPDLDSCPFSVHAIVDGWGADKPSVAAGRWLGPACSRRVWRRS